MAAANAERHPAHSRGTTVVTIVGVASLYATLWFGLGPARRLGS